MVPSSETPPADEDISHEEVTSIGPVPTSEPDDSRRADASATFVDGSQNTKPVEPVCTVRGLYQAGAPADNTSTPRPLCPQATVRTQTNEMNQPRAETSWKDETPTTPTETIIPRPTPSKSIRTRCKGWRKADLETPYGPAPEFEGNLWAALPFAEATWRPIYRVRAVTSADDVDPLVQEVLDLPILNLAVA